VNLSPTDSAIFSNSSPPKLPVPLKSKISKSYLNEASVVVSG